MLLFWHIHFWNEWKELNWDTLNSLSDILNILHILVQTFVKHNSFNWEGHLTFKSGSMVGNLTSHVGLMWRKFEQASPQAAQANECLIMIHVISYCVILKIAMNIKDLYGNSGNRFKKINTRRNFSKKHFVLLTWFCSCFLCVYFPDPLQFKPSFYPSFTNKERTRLQITITISIS